MALLAACGDDPGLRTAPRSLHFGPAHPELTLEISHRGDQPLGLSRIRVDHRDPDWSGFTIIDAVLPRQIPAHGEVVLHLRAELDHFARARGEHGYRNGSAALTFTSDGEPTRIALHFNDGTPPAQLWIRFSLLAAVAAGLIALRRRASWTVTVPAGLALAIAPLGAGLCWDLFASLGPADLQQCADGRGGTSVQMLAHADALGLWLAAYLLVAARAISPAELVRRLSLALAVLALAFAGGSLDPQALGAAQSGLHWGLWVQPFATLSLLLAALAEVAAVRAQNPLAARISALGLAALITGLCLGGSDLPALSGTLPHAADLGLGLVSWLLKALGVAALLLRAPTPRRTTVLVVCLLLAQLLWSLLHAPAPVP